MRAALALLLAVVALSVGAAMVILLAQPAPAAVATGDPVYRQGTYTVQLTQQACAYEELAMALEAEGIPPARTMLVTSGARHYSGCWVRDIGGDVMTQDLTGAGGTLPREGFRPPPG